MTEDHKTALEKYSSLIRLSLNKVGLTSLENFPLLNKLRIVSNIILIIQLELSKNELNGEGLEILATQCPALYKLKIDENKIESIDKLQSLKDLKIKKLNVDKNPFTSENEKYRDELFKILPELISIDDKNKEGGDVESTSYEGEENDFGEFGEQDDDLEGEEFEDGEDDIEGYEEEDDENEEEEDDGNKPNKKKKEQNIQNYSNNDLIY